MLAAIFDYVVPRAMCCAVCLNRQFSRPYQSFGVDEGICSLVEVCGAAPHAQHIVLQDVALSLSHYHWDNGFGYALGIDVVLDAMRLLKSRMPEDSDVRSGG